MDESNNIKGEKENVMNKQELLDDLTGKEWCDSLNGLPELQETKADGGKWYNQNMREIQSDSVAVYRNIAFYVVDENMKDEAAYYKDAIPDTITSKINTFTEKVTAYASKNDNISVEKTDEENGFAIIRKYVETDTQASEKHYLVKEVSEKIVVKEII